MGEDNDLFSAIQYIDIITKERANSEAASDADLTLFLRSWWSKYYSRPLKDPILDTYTVEELYYEYADKVEREKAVESKAEEEYDRIEEEKEKASIDWAEQEEARELAEIKKKQEEETWMKEQIKKEKELHGEDFGEDISIGSLDIE